MRQLSMAGVPAIADIEDAPVGTYREH